ncbi:hypothetical protein B0I12_002108 [Microbacterium hydrothermale]|nr:hypothetical protein [Microbacterium hydrothermale]
MSPTRSLAAPGPAVPSPQHADARSTPQPARARSTPQRAEAPSTPRARDTDASAAQAHSHFDVRCSDEMRRSVPEAPRSTTLSV